VWKICNNIWKTGYWPKDWCTTINVTISPLHSSHIQAKLCSEFSFNASEAFWILRSYRSGKGIREQISNVRQIIEKAREFAKPSYLCFLDSKAFGCVSWLKFWKALLEMGTPQHLMLLLKHLYENSSATVRLEDETFPIPYLPCFGRLDGWQKDK